MLNSRRDASSWGAHSWSSCSEMSFRTVCIGVESRQSSWHWRHSPPKLWVESKTRPPRGCFGLHLLQHPLLVDGKWMNRPARRSGKEYALYYAKTWPIPPRQNWFFNPFVTLVLWVYMRWNFGCTNMRPLLTLLLEPWGYKLVVITGQNTPQ